MPDPRLMVFVDGAPLDDDALASLARVEVRESDGEPSIAALRFHLAQLADGAYAPLDDAVVSPASRLRVDLEPPGGRAVALFHGYVTHLRPHFESVESNSYLEVIATDAAALLDAEERAHAYPDATDAEAAAEVFRRYNLPLEAEATSTRHEARGALLVQRATDWAFVQMLARRNGFVCYLEPDARTGEERAYFRPRALRGPSQADLTILREDPNLKWVDLQVRATGPARVTGTTIDPVAKRLIRAAGAPALPPLGEATFDGPLERALRGAGATGAGALLRDAPPAAPALEAAGSAATDRALFAVEARGELDPALYRGVLRARRTAPIKGVGRTFTGLYYVRSVRTVYEVGGAFSQTFVAERNALGLSGSEDFGRRAEEVPPQ